MPLFQELGRALRWLRDSQGKRQYQVAEAAGVTKAMLSAYETGKQKPSLDTLERLLEAMGCDLSDLHRALQIITQERRDAWGNLAEERPLPPRPASPEPRAAEPSEVARLVGIAGPLPSEEERAFAEMLQGFVRLLRFLHERIAATTRDAEEPARRR